MGDMLWGGRFSSDPHHDMLRLTSSITFDMALLEHDLVATKAHAAALLEAGLLDADANRAVASTCDEIAADLAAGRIAPDPRDEDVHSFVERELTERLGETGRRIHAGRSRNDLVATDLRLWVKDATTRLLLRIGDLVSVMAGICRDNASTVMPGYTHLQRAQPVTLAFHLAAHAFALIDDGERVRAAARAAGESPLGAGALAGTTLPLDPEATARRLDFDRSFRNAMHAVSDRGFACDLVYACCLCCLHLSRLAEEVILWTSSEFSFASLDDAWSTGSSMMPQKRNPDVAELVRGRAAGAVGDLASILGLLKGLPSSYNRDLQEDKLPVFRAAERTEGCLVGMTGLMRSLTFDGKRMAAAAASGPTWATDLAERLVLRDVPFRDAHEAVGGLVAELERSGRRLEDLDPSELAAYHPLLEPADVEIADPSTGIAARGHAGGPSPRAVAEQIEEIERWVAGLPGSS